MLHTTVPKYKYLVSIYYLSRVTLQLLENYNVSYLATFNLMKKNNINFLFRVIIKLHERLLLKNK